MIQTENTPNPNAVKFLSEQTFSEIGAREFQKKNIKDIKIGLIKNLLKFDGVELVLVSEKFISVKKNDDVTFFRVGVDIADTDNLFIDQDDVMLSLAYDDYHKKIIISIKGDQ